MKSASTVVPFRTSIKPRTISQIDLVEERLLSANLAQAIRRLEKKRDEIRAALATDTPIEPGPHFAYLTKVRRCGRKYDLLVVR
jgi:hypothetical protein